MHIIRDYVTVIDGPSPHTNSIDTSATAALAQCNSDAFLLLEHLRYAPCFAVQHHVCFPCLSLRLSTVEPRVFFITYTSGHQNPENCIYNFMSLRYRCFDKIDSLLRLCLLMNATTKWDCMISMVFKYSKSSTRKITEHPSYFNLQYRKEQHIPLRLLFSAMLWIVSVHNSCHLHHLM